MICYLYLIQIYAKILLKAIIFESFFEFFF